MRNIALSALALTISFAPAAQAIDFEPTENSRFSVYGELAPSIKSETNAQGDDELQYADEGSIIGFNGEHRITDEFQVYASAEFEFFTDDTNPGFNFDEGWFGVKGDSWGRVQGGGQENPFTYLINDTVNVAEIAEITGDDQLPQEDNMIVYRSPSFGGFSVASKVRLEGEGDAQSPAGQNDNEVDVGAVAGYSGERFSLRAAYTTVDAGSQANPTVNTDGEHYGVAGDVSFGPATVAAKFAKADIENSNTGNTLADLTRYAGTGMFSYGQFIEDGAGKLYGSVQQVERDNNNRDWTEITVGVDYKPIDNFKVYGEAGWFDRQNDAGDVIGVGAIYSF